MATSNQTSLHRSVFAVGGYRRLLLALEADVRPEVEEEYAERRNAANCFRRWFLDREIEREVARRVEERSKLVSPESLY